MAGKKQFRTLITKLSKAHLFHAATLRFRQNSHPFVTYIIEFHMIYLISSYNLRWSKILMKLDRVNINLLCHSLRLTFKILQLLFVLFLH